MNAYVTRELVLKQNKLSEEDLSKITKEEGNSRIKRRATKKMIREQEIELEKRDELLSQVTDLYDDLPRKGMTFSDTQSTDGYGLRLKRLKQRKRIIERGMESVTEAKKNEKM